MDRLGCGWWPEEALLSASWDHGSTMGGWLASRLSGRMKLPARRYTARTWIFESLSAHRRYQPIDFLNSESFGPRTCPTSSQQIPISFMLPSLRSIIRRIGTFPPK